MHRPTLRSPAPTASLAINLLVAPALATSLLRQEVIPEAEAARELPPVGAEAFARVALDANGFLNKARSRNARSVQHPATGVSCPKLPVTVKNAVASLRPRGKSPLPFLSAGLVGPDGNPSCPDGSDAYALTRSETGPVNTNFFVVIHRPPAGTGRPGRRPLPLGRASPRQGFGLST